MFARVFLILGLAAGATSNTWSDPGGSSAPGEGVARAPGSIVEADFDRLLSGICMRCSMCPGNPRHHSLAFNPPPRGGNEGDHPEKCEWGQCTEAGHAPCGGGMGDRAAVGTGELEAMLAGIRTATPAELGAVLAQHPLRVRVNYARRALQLVGCEDQIVASVGATTVPALQDLLDS